MIEQEQTTTPAQETGPHPSRRHNDGIGWAEFHRRLETSQSALRRGLSPTLEEKRTILRARAQLLAEESKEQGQLPGSFLEVVEFLLGSEHYGIELRYIREIHVLSEFTPLPGTPAFVLGLANVRGQILSVIDIKKLFDLPEKGLTDLNKVIVVRTNHMELGILADAVIGVRSVGLNELQTSLPTLTGIRAEYLRGLTKDPLMLLDIDRILSDEKIVVDNAS
jgi:purine-binding chemotaxis protein CheW